MERGGKYMRFKKLIIAVVSVAVIGGAIAGINTYTKNAKAKAALAANEAQTVATESVVRQNISSVISATGSVEVEKSYSVSLSTIQEISNVLVDVGDEVTEGQALIEYNYSSSKEDLDKQLEDANISLKNAQLGLQSYDKTKTASEIAELENAIVVAEKDLLQAQLDVKDNQNKIEDAQITINDAQTALETAQKDIDYAQIDIDDAQKELDKAQEDLDKNKQLLDIGAISQQEYSQYETTYDDKQKNYTDAVRKYDTAVQTKADKETAYNTAQRDLPDLQAKAQSYEYNVKIAEYNLQKAKEDLEEGKNPTLTNDEKVKYEQQQLQIESAKIKIETIQSQIDDLTDVSVSPINGTIIEKNVEDGDVAKESEVLLRIADVSKLKVTATISEYDASDIRLGQRVTMTSDGIRDKTYVGEIIFIDPLAKASSEENVVTVDVSLENSDESLKPGFTMDLEITTAEANDALTVPKSAIATDKDGQKYIFTVVNDILKKTIVTTGVYGDLYVEITEGVNENDIVVSSPNTSMEDGQSISAVNSDAPKLNQGDDKDEDKDEDVRGNQVGPMGGGQPPMGGGGPR